MRLSIEGDKEVIRRLGRLATRFPKEMERALKDECSVIQAESMKECPVKYGLLRSTCRLRLFYLEGDPYCTISYRTHYAVYVHENLEAFHMPPTKAKFLEDPVNRHQRTFLKNVYHRAKALTA